MTNIRPSNVSTQNAVRKRMAIGKRTSDPYLLAGNCVGKRVAIFEYYDTRLDVLQEQPRNPEFLVRGSSYYANATARVLNPARSRMKAAPDVAPNFRVPGINKRVNAAMADAPPSC